MALPRKTATKPPSGASLSERKSGNPAYVPDSGHLIWLTFDPQAGREQAGRRPAIVLSPAAYNARTNLCVVCPVTSRVKGYPFEITLPSGLPLVGVILADQIKSADWVERKAEYAGHVPATVLSEVRARLTPLLGLG